MDIAAPIEDETRLGRDHRWNLERAIAECGNDMNRNGYASTVSHKVTGTAVCE
jgi:hypothetical protein